ncbi:MAG: potassium/proton antiporter [Solirubrobacteraceae bacterium]|nr:potassium/proton antiporter [Solirubrobacteraceae bacterium]
MDESRLLLVGGLLLAVGLVASLVATRLRIPGLVLFLGIGMLVGSDGLDLVDFADYELARDLGILALALILFEGGLSAGVSEIRPVWGSAVSLATVGTLLTAIITGFAAAWIFDLDLLEGMLIGSIVAATDSAAIFSMLRGSTLKRKLARILEGESGTNDPVALVLVIGFIEWIQHPGFGVSDFFVLFVEELGIGAVVGVVVGALAVFAFRRARLATGGLYPVASLATIAIAFGLADVLHGSGFLAVYLVGLALGSGSIPGRQTIVTFHDGLAWVSQLGVFLVLGLLVFPSQLGEYALQGTALALVLCFIARPIAVFIATAFSKNPVGDTVVLGWAGLRGAVPVVLATFPVIEGIPEAVDYFNIVFFIVLFSTILQGTTFLPLAGRLHATTNEDPLARPVTEIGTINRLGADMIEVRVREGDAVCGHRVRDLGLPREALVNVLVRGDRALPPRGSTKLEAGDRLHMVVRRELVPSLEPILQRWRSGPVGPVGRPQRILPGTAPIFTSRPWRESDGDVIDPAAVLGLPVIERLRRRWDVPGAVVVLQDGRLAVTGPRLIVGSPDQVLDYARRMVRQYADGDDDERAWWREVLGEAAQ